MSAQFPFAIQSHHAFILQQQFFRAVQRQELCLPDLQPAGLIELQDVAEHMGLQDKSLQKLFANFFHMRISKGAQLSNWEADALTEAQRLYAATDAAACILLYREMLALQQSRDYQLVG